MTRTRRLRRDDSRTNNSAENEVHQRNGQGMIMWNSRATSTRKDYNANVLLVAFYEFLNGCILPPSKGALSLLVVSQFEVNVVIKSVF